MTNPCFEWINWNSVCQTIGAAVRQTKTVFEGVLSTVTEESAVVRQPSPRCHEQATHRASVCTRAVYAARPLPHTREGGVDRGEGIVTDGGTGSKRVTVRVDDPEIVAALEDADTQSDAVRAALRQTYGGDTAHTADGVVPEKAAEAYDWLIDYCGIGGRIDIEAARSLIAQKFQINKAAVDNLVIRPLDNEDRIGVQQGMQAVSLVVKQRPSTEADGQEVPADD